jgi:predicted GNAT family acetyltransferase
MENVLDNVVWEALGSRQAALNAGNARLRYFDADVAPFVGMQDWSETDQALLAAQLPDDRPFSAMIAKPVTIPAAFKTVFSIPLYQMICPVLKPYPGEADGLRELTAADIPAMLELTALTKPGPFYQRTISFGRYFGIFKDGKLAAMAGERLKVNGYTEVSAICSDPGHAGKGYSAQLLTKVAGMIMERGETPFLHVRFDNERAISMYQKTGFEIRSDVHFEIFRK